MAKRTTDKFPDHLKLAKPRKIRLFDADDRRITKEARRTGQKAVELIRQAVCFGLPELLAPQDQ